MRAVKIGILGLGPRWESCYRPSLERLSERIRVCAVFDWVPMKARLAARKINAAPMEGVLSLVSRQDVRGVLLLEAGWLGRQHFGWL